MNCLQYPLCLVKKKIRKLTLPTLLILGRGGRQKATRLRNYLVVFCLCIETRLSGGFLEDNINWLLLINVRIS